MRSITKTKNLIVALVLGIVCLIAGLFIFEKKGPLVTASADEIITETYIEGFSMKDQMELYKDPEEPFCRLTVDVTQDMANNLSKATTVKSLFFGLKKEYIPSEYYLSIRRTAPGVEDYIVNYHIDPEHAVLSGCTGLVVEGTTCYLKFPIETNFETEYTYYCQYGQLTEFLMENIPLTSGSFFGALLHGRYQYEKIADSKTSVTRSIGNVARDIMATQGDSLTEKQLDWMKTLAGFNSSSDLFTVIVIYKDVIEFGRIETLEQYVQISCLYIGSGDMVYAEVERVLGFYGIHNFNAMYKDDEGRPVQIILQAESYTYSYDPRGVGTLTIVYRDFAYKDFAIRITDNDPENETNLYYNIYATKISQESISMQIHIDFIFSEIETRLLKELGWVFSITPSDCDIANNSDHISVGFTDKGLRVSFGYTQENELANVSVLVLANIIPDYTCNVDIKYSALSFSNQTIVETEEIESTTMWYSEYVRLCTFSMFKQTSFYQDVKNALVVNELDGQEFFIPKSVVGHRNEDGSCELQVLYNYNTIFQITTNKGGVNFIACTKISLTYKISDLGIAPNAGWRIKSLTSNGPVEIKFDEANTSELSVTLNCSAKENRIIPLYVVYSDAWNLNIVYMETYKDTPFAEQKEYTTSISLADYDVKNLTLEQVKQILNRTDDMIVCGIARPDKTVKTELTADSTYTATLSYGVCSLKQIDYDGNSMEIRVPLTSYADWCKTFGDDMTILYLNTVQKKYFEYSNEVERDKLYGFFSVAVFEEQVTDFNYYFRKNTGDGNMVIFEQRTATGSALYQFFDQRRSKGGLLAIGGHVGMAFCELIDDSNKVLHSYFFYMDATEGYISNGGATDRDDADGALKNTLQEWKESMSAAFDKVKLVFGIILGVAALGGVTVAVVWVVRKIKDKNENKKE